MAEIVNPATPSLPNVVRETRAREADDLAGVSMGELNSRLSLVEARLHLERVTHARIARLEHQRQLVDERIAELQGDGYLAHREAA